MAKKAVKKLKEIKKTINTTINSIVQCHWVRLGCVGVVLDSLSTMASRFEVKIYQFLRSVAGVSAMAKKAVKTQQK